MNLLLELLLAFIIGGGAGAVIYNLSLSSKTRKFREQMNAIELTKQDILARATTKANSILEESERKAYRIEEQATKGIQQTQEKLEHIEKRLIKREERLDEKREALDKTKDMFQKKEQELQEAIELQTKKLSDIAKLSPQEAKKELMKQIQADNEQEIKEFVDKYRTIKKEEAEEEAKKTIAAVMPRIVSDVVDQFTTELIDIPDESFKGKLIGRDGRNINFFEKTTGVEMIIDDTPGVVRLSCYDHDQRFIASAALKKLIKDGRINPFHIERLYHEVSENFDETILEKGKEALHILNIPMMNPELTQLVGKFYLRYSYGQSLRSHSIEVAKIAETIASEMGEDPIVAKKAGLLHDVGKVIAENGESHTVVGADTLRKFGMHEAIVNAAASHHYETPMTHLISWIVTAADAISASRPGARFNTRDFFVEKMTKLENLIMDIEGIKTVHIMQAGREIMVYVDPQQILDQELSVILKKIGTKIESQLDYPGVIRISLMRENKLIEHLK